MRVFFMRDVFRDDYVRIYSTIGSKEYVTGIPDKMTNPMFIDMGFIKCTLTLKFDSVTFKINQTNKPRVDRFFGTVDDWFRDPNMHDLFIYNAKNRLEFNPKYSKLKRIVYSGNDSHQFMEATPTVITNSADRDVEGVVLNIDSTSNAVLLTIDEFDTITNVIQDFNFQNEIILGYMRYLTLPNKIRELSKVDKPKYDDERKKLNPFLK